MTLNHGFPSRHSRSGATKLIAVDVEAAAKETGIEIADISSVLENLRVGGYLEDPSSSNVVARVKTNEVPDMEV